MSKMAKQCQNFYTAELSLLLAVVLYCNSFVMVFDSFLSYELTVLVAALSSTCCFLLIRHFMKMSKSFEPLTWNFLFLMAAHLTTCGNSSNWDLSRGFLSLLIGFSALSLYTIFMICYTRFRPLQRREQVPENNVSVPLVVQLSFVFMGNGIAMMGRWLFPSGSILWMSVGGAIMFFISAAFFYYYCLCSMGDLGDQHQLHKESTVPQMDE